MSKFNFDISNYHSRYLYNMRHTNTINNNIIIMMNNKVIAFEPLQTVHCIMVNDLLQNEKPIGLG